MLEGEGVVCIYSDADMSIDDPLPLLLPPSLPPFPINQGCRCHCIEQEVSAQLDWGWGETRSAVTLSDDTWLDRSRGCAIIASDSALLTDLHRKDIIRLYITAVASDVVAYIQAAGARGGGGGYNLHSIVCGWESYQRLIHI